MTSGTFESAMPEALPASSRKAITAALIGNLLEWYDFAVYGFLALTIAKLFFPAGDETVSLLASVAAFGVGFLMRPVGALVLGTLADRKGRKPALTAIILLMALGTAMIGFAPTYEQAGIWGPAIVVLGRLIQGFSAGGEFGSAAAYLVEQADTRRRSFYGSWWQATVSGALLLGSAVSAGVTGLLTQDELLSWGWRIPFLLGLLIGPVGFYIRARAPETLTPKRMQSGPLRTAFAVHWRAVAAGFGLVIVNTVCTYFFLVNMPTFAVRQLHIAQHDALLANAATLVVSAISALLAGKLADRAGAFRPMAIAVLFTAVAVYPALAWLLAHPDITALIIVQIVFAVPLGAMLGILPSFMASLFPASARSTGLSIAYNGANSLFGGFTPFIVTWLVAQTGDAQTPAFYVAAAAVVSLIALLLAPRGTAAGAGSM
jgi:MHS family proline/betaine transporter-like MFS transporter